MSTQPVYFDGARYVAPTGQPGLQYFYHPQYGWQLEQATPMSPQPMQMPPAVVAQPPINDAFQNAPAPAPELPALPGGQDSFAPGQGMMAPPMRPPQSGGFSVMRAGGEFVRGAVVDTLAGLFSWMGLATIGATWALIKHTGKFGKFALPFLLAGGAIISAYQLLKGLGSAAVNLAVGNTQQAEQSFRGIGNGVMNGILTIFGVRGMYKHTPELTQPITGKTLPTVKAEDSIFRSLVNAGKRLYYDVTGQSHVIGAPEKGTTLYQAGREALGEHMLTLRNKTPFLKDPDKTQLSLAAKVKNAQTALDEASQATTKNAATIKAKQFKLKRLQRLQDTRARLEVERKLLAAEQDINALTHIERNGGTLLPEQKTSLSKLQGDRATLQSELKLHRAKLTKPEQLQAEYAGLQEALSKAEGELAAVAEGANKTTLEASVAQAKGALTSFLAQQQTNAKQLAQLDPRLQQAVLEHKLQKPKTKLAELETAEALPDEAAQVLRNAEIKALQDKIAPDQAILDRLALQTNWFAPLRRGEFHADAAYVPSPFSRREQDQLPQGAHASHDAGRLVHR